MQAHLRKMGDVFVRVMRLRGQWDLDPAVEGRDSDDGWMIVDCGDVVVQLFLEDARSHFAVEELWVTNGCTKVPVRLSRAVRGEWSGVECSIGVGV